MADKISKEHRSWNMSRIKGKDTDIEKKVRSYLFSRGFRFRKNDKRYPGKPDVVLPKYKTVIFVNGCFWHHHKDCKIATIPKSEAYDTVKNAREGASYRKNGGPLVRVVSKEKAAEIREKETAIGMM